MREPAVHCPPATDTRSLSATGTPSSGWRRSSAAVALAARGREPGVRGIGLGERALVVERQPRVEAVVRAVGAREVRGRDLARGRSRRRAAARRARARTLGQRRLPASTSRSVAAEDRGHDEEVAVALGRVREDVLDRHRRPRDVLAQDVLELDRLGRRRDRVRVQLGELRVLVEDVVELALEPAELVAGQPRRARWATCSTSARVSDAMRG